MGSLRSRGKWYALITGLAALFVVACGGTEEPVATPAPAAAPPAAQPAPVATPVPAKKEAATPKTSAGEILYVLNQVPSVWGGFNSVNAVTGHTWTCDDLWTPTKQDVAAPRIAESFEVADDFTFASVKIREGIPFHFDFGELTAEDVVWSYNDANPGVNPESVTDGSGTWAGFLSDNSLEVLDTYTLKITWANFDPRWRVWYFGQDGLGACIYSKRAFEEKGYDWNLDNVVGTGPFKLLNWVRGDRFEFERVDDHWLKTPDAETVTQLAVPDETVRLAMMETGEADITELPLAKIVEAQERGLVAEGSGAGQLWSMWFSGNLWEEKDVDTGEIVTRATFVHDIPWIGNPIKPEDGNNPAGIDDMEQARLVRLALAHALDRELINERILGGLGFPAYLPYFSPILPEWDDKWKYEYDPAKSEELLEQAGYPRKNGGFRFDMPIFVWPAGHFLAPVGDAVAGFWRDVGVNVITQHYQYSVFRPGNVVRSNTVPWLESGPLGSYTTTPYDWPRGIQCSTLTRGGKSHGAEFPICTESYLGASKETSLEGRLDINRTLADWQHFWVPAVGVVGISNKAIFNPKKIESWDMFPGIRQRVNSPENIKLR